MSDDHSQEPEDPIRDTLDYVPRAEAIVDDTVQAEQVDEVVSGGRRRGSTGIVLAGVGIGCLLIVVMCAGVIGIGVYKARQVIGGMFITEPEQVRQQTAELAEIDIPDTFDPRLAVQLPDFVVNNADGEEPYRWVIYTYTDGPGYLALGFFNGNGNDDDANGQLEGLKGFLAQTGESHASIKITDEEVRDMTIRGEDASFTFSHGTVEPSGEGFHQVIGHFQGKRQRTWLIIQMEESAWDEAEITDVIESIK